MATLRCPIRFNCWIITILSALVVAKSSFAQTTSAVSLDVDNGNGITSAGMLTDGKTYDFHADLFTGRFMYGIPIVLPPGRQGSQPKIALGYNSSGGNGWCGMGWSLDVGYIQRDTRYGVPVLWSGTNVQTAYDDSKGFIANFGGSVGQLVLVSATNVNPLIYRQKVDTSFSTYYYYPSDDYWQVIDKSGNTFYFGQGTNNQMENPKPGWTSGAGSSTFRWALNQSIDANGNQSIFSYTNDSGALYLQRISYNGNTNTPTLATNTVDFILTNRSDTNFTFVSSYKVTTKQRLSEIQVRANGAPVRKYVLTYSNSPCTLRSLLASVTEYGTDFSTHLPPISFQYQVEQIGTYITNTWTNVTSQGSATSDTLNYDAIRAYDTGSGTANGYAVDMIDMDGDGLPDRVMRQFLTPTKMKFIIQRNTGAGFAPEADWGPICNSNISNYGWQSPLQVNSAADTGNELIDLNGDGYPDLVQRQFTSPYNSFTVQLNSGVAGTNGLALTNFWPVTNYDSTDVKWRSVRFHDVCELMDMNGDGLPDRVSANVNRPWNSFKVQINTGTNFLDPVDWAPLNSQGDTGSDWNSLYKSASDNLIPNDTYFAVTIADMNGDGLPDRVMRMYNTPYTQFAVQFNNGAGFETNWEYWGPVDTLGNPNSKVYGSPVTMSSSGASWTTAQLIDVNGDGLPDRIISGILQLNTGSGLGPTNSLWGTYRQEYKGGVYTELVDINGDGLPDYVVTPWSGPASGTNWTVYLAAGPFPDLLNVVSNGLGGCVQISYTPSTKWNNRDRDWTYDPWLEGAKSLLPSVQYTVSQVRTFDGMGNVSTNSYAYKGGYFNAKDREFRGFAETISTDPLGTTNITYFHQSGGRDNSALGEYLDQGTESKKGIPFRVDVIGSDGATNSITLSKIEEILLHTNGWYFPFVSQSITMNFEGLTNTYLATAKQFTYDTNNGNLIAEAFLGGVTSVVFTNQSFINSDSDSIYTWINYATIGNILDRPSDVKVTSDSGGSNRLREKLLCYDARGNLTNSQAWLDTAGAFISMGSATYDAYGNPISVTDAAGITATSTYDSIFQQFPIQSVAGTFTNSATYDPASGSILVAADPKGLVVSNTFDVFLRDTGSYISTNAFGTASLWKSRVGYLLNGTSGGVSSNCVHTQVNDGVDAVNGHETYVYSDGLGRIIQTRSEAETGQFRTLTSCYDARGNLYFRTLPYFDSGTNFTKASGAYLGGLTEYDSIGRAFRTTPAVSGTFSGGSLLSVTPTGGDTGSPAGPTTVAFVDGANPWATVETDPNGRIKKSFVDAYGRITNIVEITTNESLTLSYSYDLLGNLTNVTDMANNSSRFAHDSLGRKISMTDPDIGTWTYTYDNAGRLIQQIDSRTNKIMLTYSDEIGRLTSKQVYDCSNRLVGTVSFAYDGNGGDANFNVPKGELYKITDLQGYQRFSYDSRGRATNSGRYLNINGMEYQIQYTYDDADNVRQLTYPGNAAVIQYSYDTVGHLSQIQSLSGTGTNETFYTVQAFDAPGRLTGWVNGCGSVTTNIYYGNSQRLEGIQAKSGTNSLQNLSYTYDKVENVTGISDGVYSGSPSASLSSITYDGLYRVTSVNSAAHGLKTFGYDSIGNVLTNLDFGTGRYQYGTKPHAVTSANSINYQYDATGNMTMRGNQALTYNSQNQLIQVATTNGSVFFGYDDAGERLWRSGTNGYSIWIGGIYEINNGRILCHVLADGKLIASFEPQCTAGLSSIIGEKRWFAASMDMRRALDWPFQNGRSAVTWLFFSWTAIIGICIAAVRGVKKPRHKLRSVLRVTVLWKYALTIICISSLLFGGIGTAEATTYNPVFYYYHANALESSNILTDRSGNIVQHFEYTTYGQAGYIDNSSAFPVSNRYTGQIIDDETGLYYYGARYYDPQLGRFIQPDPTVPDLSDQQSLNRYSYCHNNPLNATDPSGYDDTGAPKTTNFDANFTSGHQTPFGWSSPGDRDTSPTDPTDNSPGPLQKGLDGLVHGVQKLGQWLSAHAIGQPPSGSPPSPGSSAPHVGPMHDNMSNERLRNQPWYQQLVGSLLNTFTLPRPNWPIPPEVIARINAQKPAWSQWVQDAVDGNKLYRRDLARSGIRAGAMPMPGGFEKPDITWGKAETLADHFDRHGPDFGATSADEYANMASQFFRESQNSKLPTKIDGRGVIRVFDPKTGSFGSFNPNGTTRTFFKPNSSTYFDTQPGTRVK